MFRLLGNVRCLALNLAGSDHTPLLPTVRLRGDINQSKRMLESIQDAMVKMKKQGAADTPEYHEIFAAYAHLSHSVTEAARALKSHEEKQFGQMQTAQLLPAHDLSGIEPIKGTLGPRTQPGAVSHGAPVANLQKFLAAVGFHVPQSGEFDHYTQQALEQFQKQYGLKVNGVTGAETRKRINEMLSHQ